MRVIAGFFRFWYGFIVGDDWRVAAAVVVSLGLTALLAQTGFPAWWLLPSAIVLFLSLGVLAAARP